MVEKAAQMEGKKESPPKKSSFYGQNISILYSSSPKNSSPHLLLQMLALFHGDHVDHLGFVHCWLLGSAHKAPATIDAPVGVDPNAGGLCGCLLWFGQLQLGGQTVQCADRVGVAVENYLGKINIFENLENFR